MRKHDDSGREYKNEKSENNNGPWRAQLATSDVSDEPDVGGQTSIKMIRKLAEQRERDISLSLSSFAKRSRHLRGMF